MLALGWIMTIAGIGLMITSTALTVRANRGRRIPLLGWPDPFPAHSLWTQAIGIALVLAAGTMVAREIAPWNLVALALTSPVALIMLVTHNRALASQGAVDATAESRP